ALAISLFACGDNRRSATADAPPPPDAASPDVTIDASPDGDVAIDASPDGDRTAPQIVSTSPADGDTDVPLDSTIAVTFSELIDPATIDATSFAVHRGTAAIAGALSVTGAEARFAPAAPLAVDADHQVTVTTAVADPAGNHLAADATFHFTSRHRRRVFVT